MNTNEQLGDVDWSFPNLGNSGIHSLHWYPATYIAAIPGTLIPVFTKKGGLVLDPFNGSGTSGVEAIRLGRTFIGMDTNPVALLMSHAKLHFPAPKSLRQHLDIIIRDSEKLFTSKETAQHPHHKELSAWYHPDTLNTLNRLLSAILCINNTDTKRCFLAIFSGVLKNTSSQGRHWGWVCDNVKPKPFEITLKDALSIFINAANDYITITEQSHKLVQVHSENETRKLTRSRYKLVHGDCVKNMQSLPDEHIDFIVTSPPYYGVADYIKSQRLSYLWFDKDELAADQLGFRDFEKLRSHESGARSNRTRKNSHELYMNFINSFFTQCHRVLKTGSSMALVVGESGARASTTNELIFAAESKGFNLSLRRERDIKSSRRRLMASVKCEDILIFEK
ncbi:site-specific DNA-methyltransferase [Pseudomonas fragi]|uniref:DNA methyltransferase n=1 Tax=Pseudomonas fragi TaxID=296 RepID=UPI00147492E3|nr:DNA methyltransferase [Pseudomonas fragi]NNB12060.1 site-specific DNA-methyltransferase [Pseudomonas fragi]